MSARLNTGRPFNLMALALFVLLLVLVGGFIAFSCSLRAANTSPESSGQQMEGTPSGDEAPRTIFLAMVGDVCLANGWAADIVEANGGDVSVALSLDILEALNSADICYANNEFPFSTRGEPLNKYYTFRADPARVAYWQQMGVDVVGLANNHAYDYGEEAFLDTLDTLDGAGIRRVGAGRNLAEAMAPVYYEKDGYTIAFVAADRCQKGDEVRAPEVGETTPGVLFCFDETLFLQAVATAAENADFVIAIPHWGLEDTTELEEVQLTLGKKLINAGADAVIGSHPHVLQGMEYYQGKLIAYSLGDFWFNTETKQTLVLSIKITEGEPTYTLVPALQTEQKVVSSEQITAEGIQQMRSLSPALTISDEGVISPAG